MEYFTYLPTGRQVPYIVTRGQCASLRSEPIPKKTLKKSESFFKKKVFWD
jgi:hypothetical protein